MREKARIDRARLLREEAVHRRRRDLLAEILRELEPGEMPGTPFRCALGIIIPIEPSQKSDGPSPRTTR